MVRPISIFGEQNLKEMLDSDVNYLSYKLRVNYANQLDASGQGSLYYGAGSDDSIGELSDTITTQQTASQARNNSGGPDYPAYPGIGIAEHTMYKYKQKRTAPSWPSDSSMDSHGYVGILGHTPGETTSFKGLSIVGGASGQFSGLSQSGLDSDLFKRTIYKMRDSGGDNIGTYKVATSQPDGDANWKDKGAWYVDNTYSAADTTYKLWLKTDSDAPGRFPKGPIKMQGSGHLKEMDSADVDNLITNCLLPAFTRYTIQTGALHYSVLDSVPGHNRGSFWDTRQGNDSAGGGQSQSFSDPTYYSTSTPQGLATIHGAVRYLVLNNDSS